MWKLVFLFIKKFFYYLIKFKRFFCCNKVITLYKCKIGLLYSICNKPAVFSKYKILCSRNNQRFTIDFRKTFSINKWVVYHESKHLCISFCSFRFSGK